MSRGNFARLSFFTHSFSDSLLHAACTNSKNMLRWLNMEQNNIVKDDSQIRSPMSEVYGYKGKLQKPMEINMESNGKPNEPKKPGFIKKYLPFLWELAKIIIIAVIIVVPVRYFIFQPFIVKGDSMVPNFHSGDYLIVDEISYRFVNPQRGDVVVLKYPLDTTQRFIKRIIGLPGETVQIRNGNVDILKSNQDIALDEKKYLPGLKATDGDIDITLKTGEYFVMGDNRPFSYDSRRWGVLPKDDIIGKAVLRILPVTQVKYISAPAY